MKKFAKVMALALIAVLSLAVLVSCGPASDPDKAEAALKENGYAPVHMKGAISTGATALLLGLKGEDVTDIVFAVNADGDGMLAIYCKDSGTAKSVLSKAQESIKKIEDTLKIKFEGESNVQRSGKVLYTGTEAGIKAAR